VDFYALVERALKYGIMFVAAVFGLVFFLEILSPRRIHIVQYAIVGLIVVFFYVLLLALSEHIGFGWAYLSASTATGTVITGFVGLALASRIRAIVAALGFTGLFALLYAILTLEDIALLAGALTGFVALTFVLFATRKVDWSGARAVPAGPTAASP
jgi:inner membrane protein